LILDEVFSAANQIIGYINDAGLAYSRGATIFYSAHKIQYRYQIYLGTKSSKVNIASRLIKSKLNRPLNVGRVLSISGVALPDHQSLDDYFIIDKNTGATIDIPAILTDSKSEEIIIQFEKDMSPIQLQSLVPLPHIFKRPVYFNDEKMETPVEIIVDYANMWYKRFEWFRIVDIRRRYVVSFEEGKLKELLPLSLKSLVKAIEENRTNQRPVQKRIQSVSGIFRKFRSDPGIQHRLSDCLSTDKPRNIEFSSIHGDLKKLNIRGAILDLPYSLDMRINIMLDSKDLAVSAKIVIDLQKIYSIVQDLSDEVDKLLRT
jgi:hypothetical protein